MQSYAGFCLYLANICRKTSAENKSKVTLNFNATDINAVIAAVSEMTGRNFIVDPRVKGKVTVISHRELKSSEVYQVFLSVLKVHGFAAIPGKNVTKIVPEVNAKQDAISTGQRTIPVSDEFITQVLEIKNVDAAQLGAYFTSIGTAAGSSGGIPGFKCAGYLRCCSQYQAFKKNH